MPTPNASFELSVSLGDDSFFASGKYDLVLKAFEEFKAMTGRSVAAGSKAAPRTGPAKQRGSGSDGGQNASAASGLLLPAYIDMLTLMGNKERVTAILVWSAENGKEALTPAEIKALWVKTHLKPAANLSRDIAAAAKKGWIASEGQGWVAHGFGKKAVAGWAAPKE